MRIVAARGSIGLTGIDTEFQVFFDVLASWPGGSISLQATVVVPFTATANTIAAAARTAIDAAIVEQTGQAIPSDARYRIFGL